MNRSVRTLLMIAFGYITFFSAVLFSVSSRAESAMPEQTVVVTPAAFIASSCGDGVTLNGTLVGKVCAGRLQGEPKGTTLGAFEFSSENEKPVVYRVTAVQNQYKMYLSGAKSKVVFMVDDAGNEISMKILQMPDGTFQAASDAVATEPVMVHAFQQLLP